MLLWRILGFFVSLFNLVGNLTKLSPENCHTFSGLWLKFLFSWFWALLDSWVSILHTCIGSEGENIFQAEFIPRIWGSPLWFLNFLLHFPPAIVALKYIPSFFKPVWLKVSIQHLAIQHGRTRARPQAKLVKTEKSTYCPSLLPSIKNLPHTNSEICPLWVTLLLKTIF